MKILVLSASVGAGHVKAAEAVAEALKKERPDATVQHVDVLRFADAAFRGAYGAGYLMLVHRAPHLVGYLYDRLDRPPERAPMIDGFRRMVQRWFMRGLSGFLASEDWDLIVNTHFLPAEIIAGSKRRAALDAPQATVVTDLECHRMWASQPCERFFVASESAAHTLEDAGVPRGWVTISGIPIRAEFAAARSRSECRERLDLPKTGRVVLLLSGGSGTGPLEEAYKRLLSARTPMTVVVVTGSNAAAKAVLDGLPVPDRHETRVLGYTSDMRDYMGAADLAVTKPGGLTTAEALACGLPLAIIHPIPGQETRNSDFLLENGAGVKIASLAGLAGKVDALFAAPGRLQAMRRNALKLARPDAATLIAREALSIVRPSPLVR